MLRYFALFPFSQELTTEGQAKSGWRRENQPEIHAGSARGLECASGNKRVAPNPTYLFTAIEAQLYETAGECVESDRYEGQRESGIESRGVERAQKNER